jgi:hypothetical protein
MTTAHVRSIMKSVIASGFDPTEMQWFDISGADLSTGIKIDNLTTHRPPFEKSLVLWAGQTSSHERYEMMMLAAGDDPEEGIVLDLSKGQPGKYTTFPPMVYAIVDGQIKYGPVDEGQDLPRDVAEIMLATMSKWLESMDTGCECYQPVITNTFTNRRKIAAGKTPTYDWRTVKIGPKTAKGESKGGTHASPRLHDRRGHIRRLASGKNVWVKACKVGDASLGTVFHDYKIEAK